MLPFLVGLMMAGIPLPFSELVVEPERTWTREELKSYALEVATEYGLHKTNFLKTIECESNWNRFAVGDNGLSHGLAQLYYPTRDWGIATSSAYDPEIALPIIARAWLRNEAYRWTCWRNISSTTASSLP